MIRTNPCRSGLADGSNGSTRPFVGALPARSSSTIVPVAVLVPSVAFAGDDSSRRKFSSRSYTASSRSDTDTVRLDSPGANVSVPEAPS